MEINPNQKMEYLSRPSRLIRKCINCGSIYITDKECEACGYQLLDPDLGEPVDERSFYSIRETYFDKLNFLEKRFFKNRGRKYKEYRNSLLHRYRSLIKSMESPWEDLAKWNYFHFELIDLTKFLSLDPKNDAIMGRIFSSLIYHPFYHEIKLAWDHGRIAVKEGPRVTKNIKLVILFLSISSLLIISAPLIYKAVLSNK
jgi:hypothetical protein